MFVHRISPSTENMSQLNIVSAMFRSLCTHKDSVNEFQKPGVYRIPCECGLVYIGETGRNLSLRLKEHKTNCEKAELEKSAAAKHS